MAEAAKLAYMFCPLSGCLMKMDYHQQCLVSPETGYRVDFNDLPPTATVHATDMKKWRKKNNIRSIIQGEDTDEEEIVRTRATTDEPCPKCQHRPLEYYTMQLRSADEGQTVFYECKACGYKFQSDGR